VSHQDGDRGADEADSGGATTAVVAIRPPEPLGATLYWRLVGAVILVLVPLDLLSTGLALATVGGAYEANPLARLALDRGFHVYAVVEAFTGATVLGLFVVLERFVAHLPGTYGHWFGRFVVAWPVVVLAVGFVVFLNNVGFLVAGRGLVVQAGRLC